MPRGRPRKNPLPVASSNIGLNNPALDNSISDNSISDNSISDNSVSDNNSGINPQPQFSKNTYQCSRCHSVISYVPEHINMGRLTRTASWHREMPDEILLCRDCCLKLNNLIEDWYLEPDMGKTKWQEKYNIENIKKENI